MHARWSFVGGYSPDPELFDGRSVIFLISNSKMVTYTTYIM